jgi:hypothetical protein
MYMRVSSYSKLDVAKQRDMVNSGVRGTRGRGLMTEVRISYLISAPVIQGGPSGPVNYSRRSWDSTS